LLLVLFPYVPVGPRFLRTPPRSAPVSSLVSFSHDKDLFPFSRIPPSFLISPYHCRKYTLLLKSLFIPPMRREIDRPPVLFSLRNALCDAPHLDPRLPNSSSSCPVRKISPQSSPPYNVFWLRPLSDEKVSEFGPSPPARSSPGPAIAVPLFQPPPPPHPFRRDLVDEGFLRRFLPDRPFLAVLSEGRPPMRDFLDDPWCSCIRRISRLFFLEDAVPDRLTALLLYPLSGFQFCLSRGKELVFVW